MGITRQIVFEALDKIAETKSAQTRPAPNERYKYMVLRKFKRLLNKLLSRVGFFLVTYPDYVSSVENCPTDYAEYGVKFLKFVMENPEEIDWLFSRLADDYSRSILKWFIQYRIASSLLGAKKDALFFPGLSREEFAKGVNEAIKNSKEKYLGVYDVEGFKIRTSKMALYESFFCKQYQYKNIVYPQKGDYVLDLGAYCGETSLWFSKMVNKTRKVWAFEPESANRKILTENILKNNVKNVEIVEKGVFNENARMYITHPVRVCNNKPNKRCEAFEYLHSEKKDSVVLTEGREK